MEIVIYHIGGGDDEIGPAKAILDNFSSVVRLVLFDARPGSTEIGYQSIKTKSGVNTELVTVGVDEASGEQRFYVNEFPLSSSLLPCSPLASDEDPNYHWCRTWGENAKLKEEIMVTTTSIDSIVDAGHVPPPDFISIDAQGAELRILRGAKNALAKSVLGLVTETEFFEIYEKQGLIEDQLALLSSHGFRLVEIYNKQHWFPGPRVGKGFLTLGESLFIKFLQFDSKEASRGYQNAKTVSAEQLFKIAIISFSFDRLSYFYSVMKYLELNHQDAFERYNCSPFEKVYEKYSYIKTRYDRYLSDNKYFSKNLRVIARNFLNMRIGYIPGVMKRKVLEYFQK